MSTGIEKCLGIYGAIRSLLPVVTRLVRHPRATLPSSWVSFRSISHLSLDTGCDKAMGGKYDDLVYTGTMSVYQYILWGLIC
jgi:hypothetical protein